MLPVGFTIDGYRITIAKPAKHPNFRISEKVELTPEYRKSIDDWCFNFFGGTIVETVGDGKILGYSHHLIMNQLTYEKLLEHIAIENKKTNDRRPKCTNSYPLILLSWLKQM